MTDALGRVVLTSGVVYSQRFPFSTTIIIESGVIAWIGDDEGLSGQMLASDILIDCDGAFIAPAFMDANAGTPHPLSADIGAAFFEENGELVPYAVRRGGGPPDEPNVTPLHTEYVTRRYDDSLHEPLSSEIEQLLANAQIAVLAPQTPAPVLAQLARSGVPFAFGSFGGEFDVWETLRDAVYGSPDAISGRAAFNAATRAGWRILGAPESGEITVGTTARLNLWKCEHLMVQTPDRRITAWSTDVRAGTPPLPDLSPDAALPTLWATMTGMYMSVINE